MRPFAELYALVTDLRNYLYDNGFLKSVEFELPVISVGNLSVGGTGKSPHTAYLISLLQNNFQIGVLSRGYGRKTHGYISVQENATVAQVGDEPLMLKQQFPDTAVSVAIERIQAVPQLLAENPNVQVILLDDAFQHRSIRAGLQMLLTAYNDLFCDDFVLPAGRLRERRNGYKRADIIVVTKCPDEISAAERQTIIAKIKPLSQQHVYFSTVKYGELYAFCHSEHSEESALFRSAQYDKLNCLLVTCIANVKPLEAFLQKKFTNVYSRHYADHHQFNHYDLESIRTAFESIGTKKTIIVTTEKDAVRLHEYREWFEQNRIPVYVQPISTAFLGDDNQKFQETVLQFLNTFATEKNSRESTYTT